LKDCRKVKVNGTGDEETRNKKQETRNKKQNANLDIIMTTGLSTFSKIEHTG